MIKDVASICATVAAVLLLGCAGLFLGVVQPGGDGVLASIRLADGSEYMVTQRCNWSGEPYTVAFYLRSPGGPWGWCYVDHEAMRWRDIDISHHTPSDTVVVTQRGVREAALDRKRNSFWIANLNREVDAPQSYQAPPFSFP